MVEHFESMEIIPMDWLTGEHTLLILKHGLYRNT